MTDSFNQARYAAMKWNTPLSSRHAKELLLHLTLPPATHLIDIGCGWGELLLLAAAADSSDILLTGIDTDPTALNRGRQAATERGLDDRVTFIQQRASDWDGTADRAICIGASHALGGTRAALARLADVVPHGRVLFGDMYWDKHPTDSALAILGSDVCSQLADLVAICRDTGWELLHLSTASQNEWDDFESRHRAGLREWLLAHKDDPRAAQVRAEQDDREREYLTVYRGVLGFAYLVLGR